MLAMMCSLSSCFEATQTVWSRQAVIARRHEDVSRAVAEFLKEDGIDVQVDRKVVGVQK